MAEAVKAAEAVEVPRATESADAASTLAAAYSHGPGKSLWVPPHHTAFRPPYQGPPVPLAELALATPLGQALAQLLSVALAPRRWEPWNAHNDHRAYPSPRSLNLTDVAVQTGRGRWLIDPVRLTAHEAGTRAAPAAPADVPVTLELYANPDRMPAGYGTLRDAAAILEAGHVSAALAEAACAHGLRPAARFPVAGEFAAADRAPVALVSLAQGTSASTGVPGAGLPWPRVAAHRSSGLGAQGRLSADPRPLSARSWHRFLAACLVQPPGSLSARPPAGWFRHRLAVGNVEGIADGLYEWRAGRLTRCGGPALQDLQDAFRFGPDVVDVAGMNLVWVMAAGLAGIVADHGTAAYRQTLLAAGATAQHVCSAAAVNGMFCRPVRSIEEPGAEAAVRVPAAEDAIYTLLIGRPRVIDFSYDLTDPRETQ